MYDDAVRWCVPAVALSLLAACSGVDHATAVPDASVDAGAMPPPAAPALPSMAPCPAGWREVVDGDVVTCDPWPEGGPAACADDEAHFVGEAGCARIGTECPADGLPVLTADATAVWVLAEAAPGGDGSRARPFRHFTEAGVSSLRPGTVLALGRGTYEGRLLVPNGVTVRGACVAETHITAPTTSESDPTVFVTRGAASVSNLMIVDTGGPGLIASGAGTSLAVDEVVVRRARIGGVIALAASAVIARNILVDETRPRAAGTLGRGVDAEGGASVELTRAVVRASTDMGVYAGNMGTALTLGDVAVLDTRAANGRFGRGINVESGATATIARILVGDAHQAGVYVGANGASLTGDHVVVRDTHAQTLSGQNGEGLLMELGARAQMTSLAIERSDEIGILVRDVDSSLELVDAVIQDTLGVTPPDGSGVGMAAWEGGVVHATRVLVARARVVGFAVLDGGESSAQDLTVRDVLPRESASAFGRGIDVTRSSLRLARAVVERTYEVAVMVLGDGAALTGEDLLIRDTASGLARQDLGMSVVVQLGGSGTITRGLFERSHTGGVFAISAGSRITLSDVLIRDVQRPGCSDVSGCYLSVALGLASVDGAMVRATRFEVSGVVDCGVQVAGPAALDLEDGVVSGNAIGACVQSVGYDLGRLQTDVRYSDNGTNLDSTSLPVPGTVDSIGPIL